MDSFCRDISGQKIDSMDTKSLMEFYESAKIDHIRSRKPISYPFQLTLTKHGQKITFSVLKKLGKGAFGIAFDARDPSQPAVSLVLKVTLNKADSKVTLNEIEALKKIGRLVAADEAHQIVVFKKVEGVSYHDFLQKVKQPHLLKYSKHQYDQLFLNFFMKYQFHHGDIRPANVIVTPNGDLELIDFGKSYAASQNPIILKQELQLEFQRSQVEYATEVPWYGRNLPHSSARQDINEHDAARKELQRWVEKEIKVQSDEASSS
jgi:serine/threonine protein kinase